MELSDEDGDGVTIPGIGEWQAGLSDQSHATCPVCYPKMDSKHMELADLLSYNLLKFWPSDIFIFTK